MIPLFWSYVTVGKSKHVTQIDPDFYDASIDILFCLRERKREKERDRKRQRDKQRKRERERERAKSSLGLNDSAIKLYDSYGQHHPEEFKNILRQKCNCRFEQ